jgi:outer membrane protein TolC
MATTGNRTQWESLRKKLRKIEGELADAQVALKDAQKRVKAAQNAIADIAGTKTGTFPNIMDGTGR